MKKNYIAPNTEMATWASMGLMQPAVGFASTSAGGTPTLDNPDLID